MPKTQLDDQMTAFCLRQGIEPRHLATFLEHCEPLCEGVVVYRKTLTDYAQALELSVQRAYQIMQKFETAGVVERYGSQGRVVVYRLLIEVGAKVTQSIEKTPTEMSDEAKPSYHAKFGEKAASGLSRRARVILIQAFGSSDFYDQMLQMAREDKRQGPPVFRRPLRLLAELFGVDHSNIKRRAKMMSDAGLITRLESRQGCLGSVYLIHDVEAWAARYPERLDGRYRILSIPGRERRAKPALAS